MVDYITIGDRDELFQAALDIVKGLLQRMSEMISLSTADCSRESTDVVFSCPGFTRHLLSGPGSAKAPRWR